MSHIRADCYFMGMTGVSVEERLSTGDLEEAHVQRALSERAAETIVLASEEKLGVASPYVVMPLENATGIILNGKTPQPFVSALKRLGLDVHLSWSLCLSGCIVGGWISGGSFVWYHINSVCIGWCIHCPAFGDNRLISVQSATMEYRKKSIEVIC